MFARRPTSKIVTVALIFSFLLCFCILVVASEPLNEDDDLEGLEELLAVDEEEKKFLDDGNKLSEADLLTKAQKIVLQLTNENAKKVIDGNEFVLLLGYAPWCHRSAELMPQFAEAATVLKEVGSPILLAKLDAERHTKAASLLGIKGFPTLILYINGSALPYTGGLTGEEIVIWARKKTGNPVIRLSSTTAAEEALRKYQVLVLGLFKTFEGSSYEEFVKAATANNEIQFVVTSNPEVAVVLFPDLKLKDNFIGLVKKEPEQFVPHENTFEEGKILEFVEYNKFPLVTTLTELNSLRVYSSPVKLQVFVFAEADDLKDLLVPLQDVARKFKSKIMFVYVDLKDDNLAKPFLTLFGLDTEDPLVTAFDNAIGSKYLLELAPTPSNLEEFCSKLLQGTLPSYYKSDPIPDTKGIVKAVVGRTFDVLVLNSSENVLLEVYTPWCITCETTTKQIEKLAKHFKGLATLTFARIDASSNEHPKLEVNDYPTLLFYPSGDKMNPIKLSNKWDSKELASFIKTKVKAAEDKVLASDQTVKDEL
ncbi:protein disulfide isomerase-like 1-5 [Aristolochia californica]|uniref:protein disulfide isomerase-like 1-5 n=1 Tax=Aristolochia californica TaxID=171875 RepID=UPI0035E1665D